MQLFRLLIWGETMLELRNVNAGYGRVQVLHDLSLSVKDGEILCLLGRNGAGKTTAMKAIMGLLPLMSGEVTLDGQNINRLPPHEIPRAGIGYVPQGRRLFAGIKRGGKFRDWVAGTKKRTRYAG